MTITPLAKGGTGSGVCHPRPQTEPSRSFLSTKGHYHSGISLLAAPQSDPPESNSKYSRVMSPSQVSVGRDLPEKRRGWAIPPVGFALQAFTESLGCLPQTWTPVDRDLVPELMQPPAPAAAGPPPQRQAFGSGGIGMTGPSCAIPWPSTRIPPPPPAPANARDAERVDASAITGCMPLMPSGMT